MERIINLWCRICSLLADGQYFYLRAVRSLGERNLFYNTSGAYKSGLDALQTKGCKAIFMSNEGVVKECYAAVTSNPNQYKDLLS